MFKCLAVTLHPAARDRPDPGYGHGQVEPNRRVLGAYVGFPLAPLRSYTERSPLALPSPK